MRSGRCRGLPRMPLILGPVVIHGRGPERAQAVADSIINDGGRASITVGDLATDAGADQAAEGALAGGPWKSWSTTPTPTNTSTGPATKPRSGRRPTTSTLCPAYG